MAQLDELFKQSVTASDATDYPTGVAVFFIPSLFSAAYHLPLPAALPPYWSLSIGLAGYWSRDVILRSTILHEPYWSVAVSIAASKAAAQSFEIKGKRSSHWQEMLVEWGGDGYVPSQMRGVMDYCTTNNGEFWEVVRVSNARGSRIIGLVHLDSLRSIRTGDPNQPVVFMDLRGNYHTLKDYQVISLCDMPDPSIASLGIGHCAAERIYEKIYELAAVNQYYREKTTGAGATDLHVIQGMPTTQIESIIETARNQAIGKGLIYYQGAIIAGIISQAQLGKVSIPLRSVPDGYDREKELMLAQLAYASAIGLDPQELNPQLVGRGALGIGAQSVVLAEKQTARGLAARDKQMTHLLNTYILPGSVTFAFSERDLRDEKQRAEVESIRAATRAAQMASGEISVPQAQQLAVDAGDLPREFLPAGDATEDTALMDEEKPVDEQEQIAPTGEAAAAEPLAPAPTPEMLQSVKALDEGYVIYTQVRKELSSSSPPPNGNPSVPIQPQPIINVTMPDIKMPEISLPAISVNLPEQKAAEPAEFHATFEPQHITVNVPPLPAFPPIPPQPPIDVTPIADALREQRPPVVSPVIRNDIQVAAPDMTPIADALRSQPPIDVTPIADALRDQPPPNVTVEGPTIHVEAPVGKPKTSRKRVVRDANGLISEIVEDLTASGRDE